MSNRLYVGNLPFHATEHLLNQRFSECGEVVSVNVMIDRMSGQSRGFGFVEMATLEGAQKALQDSTVRTLKVALSASTSRRSASVAAAAAVARRWRWWAAATVARFAAAAAAVW